MMYRPPESTFLESSFFISIEAISEIYVNRIRSLQLDFTFAISHPIYIVMWHHPISGPEVTVQEFNAFQANKFVGC